VDDVAIVEESVELLPQIGKLVYSAIASDPVMGALTLTQAKAISLLYHYGDQTVSEVAAGLAISLPAASELIDRLVDRGLVVRTQDAADKRRMIIGLTPKSLDFARRIHDLRREQVRDALSRMPRSEWPVFVKSLRVLAATLDASSTLDGSNSRTSQAGLAGTKSAVVPAGDS
jgi:DNA-binding MarR family transcriptional regulator